MNPEERDQLAAEYVLGTLDAAERRDAVALASRDPDFAASVRAWEDRLAPLDADTAAVPPAATLFQRIEAVIDDAGRLRPDIFAGSAPEQASSSRDVPAVDATGRLEDAAGIADVIDLRARLARWRAAAATAMALAAALAAVAVIDRLPKAEVPATGRYLAVVNTDGALPAMIVDVDTAGGTVTVRPVAAETPADRSLELWAIPEGGQPVSLGLVDPATKVQRFRPDRAGVIPTRGLFAVSVEPVGGSPTGAPTGPVIYSGALVPAD